MDDSCGNGHCIVSSPTEKSGPGTRLTEADWATAPTQIDTPPSRLAASPGLWPLPPRDTAWRGSNPAPWSSTAIGPSPSLPTPILREINATRPGWDNQKRSIDQRQARHKDYLGSTTSLPSPLPEAPQSRFWGSPMISLIAPLTMSISGPNLIPAEQDPIHASITNRPHADMPYACNSIGARWVPVTNIYPNPVVGDNHGPDPNIGPEGGHSGYDLCKCRCDH